VFHEAVFPEGEVGELVLLAGERVLDVDHAALGLRECVSRQRARARARG
jgi:hypothetical protein